MDAPTPAPATRILAIDDERINPLLLKHVLSKVGVRVDTAGNGEEGLALVRERLYPLIFVDVVLPGIGGVEVCRQIRGQRGDAQPAIYLLTSLGEELNAGVVDEAGADGIFFKPIVPSQIVAVVTRALEVCAALRPGLLP